jgi:predicted nucleotidyltransferase component of viral defense system
MLTEDALNRAAAAMGFQAEPLEKVVRLLALLDGLQGHPFLKQRLALKGGTALNLFVFDVPRLSVDVDLNYIGAADRKTMLAERPQMERAVQAVCGRLGITIKRVPSDHAGGKWRLSYTTVTGRPGVLELDVNFMLRTPIWGHTLATSRPVGSFAVANVPVLDKHELAAGKLAALFGRTASRDLFDARELLHRGGLDRERLRLGFVVYGGVNRRDWRDVSLDEVQADPVDVDRRLVPMLRADVAPASNEIAEWTRRLVEQCKDLLSMVLPLEAQECEFLSALNDRGDERSLPSFLRTMRDYRIGFACTLDCAERRSTCESTAASRERIRAMTKRDETRGDGQGTG